MCKHILKKNTAPQYNSNSLNCKKKQSRTNPDVKFKELLLTNKKLYRERTMSELGKPFQKKQIKIKKGKKKHKINVKMPHVNKKTTSEKWKFSLIKN